MTDEPKNNQPHRKFKGNKPVTLGDMLGEAFVADLMDKVRKIENQNKKRK